MITTYRTMNRQRGVALVIGLIFLALVSLIATVGMRQSITQERMAGGLRQESLARAGAETGARAGERELFEHHLTSNGTTRGVGGSLPIKYANQSEAQVFREESYGTWNDTGAAPVDTSFADLVGGATVTAALARQPVYILEELGKVKQMGASDATEGGASGFANYEGSGGMSPSGNSDMMMYRITARATGGVESVVRTVETTYIIRR